MKQSRITIQHCINMSKKGKRAVINNGTVIFKKERRIVHKQNKPEKGE